MFTPTDEQRDAVEKFGTGLSLRVNAYAGTGKTSTLRLMAQTTKRRGTYIAFNATARQGAKETFPYTVKCHTNHSLAFKVIQAGGYDEVKMTGRASPKLIASVLSIPEYTRISEHFVLSATAYGAILRDACQRFLHSVDEEPAALHFPRYGRLAVLSDSEMGTFLHRALPRLRELWEDMLSVTGIVPLGHDGYLKRWQLAEPVIPADYIMLDEAQDSNPVILAVIRQQKCQIVYVGDPFQQIYEWRRAINAMDEMSAKQNAFLTLSFRFGPAIAAAASQVIRVLGNTKDVRGSERVQSDVCPVFPRTIICRTNFGVMANLVKLVASTAKCHVFGGTNELKWMLFDVKRLKNGIPAEHSEFYGFANWDEVVELSAQPEGEYLRTFVRLVSQYGEDQLLKILDECVTEERADIIISTTHKAKGFEWERVLIDSDFDSAFGKVASFEKQKLVVRNRQQFNEETRILYVAMTRAKFAVELPFGVMSYFGLKNTRDDRVGYPPSATGDAASA